MSNSGTHSKFSIKNLGTHSQLPYTKTIATQSSLQNYIGAKTDMAKSMGLTFTPFTHGLTYSYATHSHVIGTQSFLSKKQFGLVKSFGTHSIFSSEKINKGVTPSHSAIVHTKHTLEFKTQSFVNTSGMTMKNNKIEYHNPKLIGGTQSGYTWETKQTNATKPLGKNAMAAYGLHGTQSIGGTHSIISNSKFGLNVGATASVNNAKKFYAKTNAKTQKLAVLPFVQFVGKLSNNAETMIKNNKVSVNGIIITDINYKLVSGDIVMVGVGHYVNNSDQVAIVK